jgi:hypothetical protein
MDLKVKVSTVRPTYVTFINDEFEIGVAGPKEKMKDYKKDSEYIIQISEAVDKKVR